MTMKKTTLGKLRKSLITGAIYFASSTLEERDNI